MKGVQGGKLSSDSQRGQLKGSEQPPFTEAEPALRARRGLWEVVYWGFDLHFQNSCRPDAVNLGLGVPA